MGIHAGEKRSCAVHSPSAARVLLAAVLDTVRGRAEGRLAFNSFQTGDSIWHNFIYNSILCLFKTLSSAGGTMADRLAQSPPTKANHTQTPAGSPDFRTWESCRTMPLVGGFSRGSPISQAPSFRRRSIFTSLTLICAQDHFASLLSSAFGGSRVRAPVPPTWQMLSSIVALGIRQQVGLTRSSSTSKMSQRQMKADSGKEWKDLAVSLYRGLESRWGLSEVVTEQSRNAREVRGNREIPRKPADQHRFPHVRIVYRSQTSLPLVTSLAARLLSLGTQQLIHSSTPRLGGLFHFILFALTIWKVRHTPRHAERTRSVIQSILQISAEINLTRVSSVYRRIDYRAGSLSVADTRPLACRSPFHSKQSFGMLPPLSYNCCLHFHSLARNEKQRARLTLIKVQFVPPLKCYSFSGTTGNLHARAEVRRVGDIRISLGFGHGSSLDREIPSEAAVSQWIERFQVGPQWLSGYRDSKWGRSVSVDRTTISGAASNKNMSSHADTRRPLYLNPTSSQVESLAIHCMVETGLRSPDEFADHRRRETGERRWLPWEKQRMRVLLRNSSIPSFPPPPPYLPFPRGPPRQTIGASPGLTALVGVARLIRGALPRRRLIGRRPTDTSVVVLCLEGASPFPPFLLLRPDAEVATHLRSLLDAEGHLSLSRTLFSTSVRCQVLKAHFGQRTFRPHPDRANVTSLDAEIRDASASTGTAERRQAGLTVRPSAGRRRGILIAADGNKTADAGVCASEMAWPALRSCKISQRLEGSSADSKNWSVEPAAVPRIPLASTFSFRVQGGHFETRRDHCPVAERLACSPPTKANLVQSMAQSLPDFRKWEWCWTVPLVGGFSRGSPVSPRPFIPAPLHSHPHRLSRPRY
ncbi:hypothetical protein PR048_006840 [Dryococelus australis]|uniref:Uncharacterized protein n=1 Tax=Dryococelus australis TaxID=614101 RepID=A0ABQ9IC25_9NEOP|nr:hypothetical protein PR048_006840 [Dryococelus australis]